MQQSNLFALKFALDLLQNKQLSALMLSLNQNSSVTKPVAKNNNNKLAITNIKKF